jgi:hypothetical protein
MTQKAITTALDTKADTTVLNNYATTVYVNNAIANIPAGSGSGGTINTDLGSENAGKIVIIDANGNIISGIVTEEDIIAVSCSDYRIKFDTASFLLFNEI